MQFEVIFMFEVTESVDKYGEGFRGEAPAAFAIARVKQDKK